MVSDGITERIWRGREWIRRVMNGARSVIGGFIDGDRKERLMRQKCVRILWKEYE